MNKDTYCLTDSSQAMTFIESTKEDWDNAVCIDLKYLERVVFALKKLDMTNILVNVKTLKESEKGVECLTFPVNHNTSLIIAARLRE